jgi:hypothetical protein
MQLGRRIDEAKRCPIMQSYRTFLNDDKRGGLFAKQRDKAPRWTHHGQVIRADLTLVPNLAADPDDGVSAPLRRRGGASRTSAKAPERQAVQPPAAPSWARASGRAGQGDPLFAAGAGLALLDAFLRADQAPARDEFLRPGDRHLRQNQPHA